ncbi:MAG: hypothetical protein EA377_07655 [Phycisphaerales bacterium]|nr:MAG: hypothetical protein EA377_07655 [Phycisphaerales bacterium]
MAMFGMLIMLLLGTLFFVLLVAFVLLPIMRGVGWTVTYFFRSVGWLIRHLVEFVAGTISDVIRLAGSLIAIVILSLFVPLNVLIGRWSAATHYAVSVKRECLIAGGCLYRALLHRPLKLFWLHGLLEGVEQRVPMAMEGAPTADRPRGRSGQFDGYEIVGSLRAGGSGGKLYVARPDEKKQRKLSGKPELVVIKSFTLSEGSSLPQIVRESRALESAKKLGHVLDHGMDDQRFFYVMPYHPGDHLGVVTRHLHAASSERGLDHESLGAVLSYVGDLLDTLVVYHEGGLWHKDVKPENIIVHDGKAHLVDLGLVTPLKSAMTLTTHGTEYFRDPEMVRMALRGVKVHQVNGAKFDIYAAGAVLYFVLENEFPAHGGLSRFNKTSPEALRWVVRRAMAEYHQRYESANEMRQDLAFIAASSDPFSIKPANLPSMRDGGNRDSSFEVDDSESTFEYSPRRAPKPEPVGPPPATPPAPAVSSRRPRLRVTNWWTGEYVVDQPGRRAHQIAAKHTRGKRRSPAPPAAYQPYAAQAGHASAGRKRARAQGPMERANFAVFVITTLVLSVGLWAVFMALNWGAPSPMQSPAVSSVSAPISITRDDGWRVDFLAEDDVPPVLFVHFAADGSINPRPEQHRDTIRTLERAGYRVVHDPALLDEEIRETLKAWNTPAADDRDRDLIEDWLAEHELQGFLRILVDDSTDEPSVDRYNSVRSNASQRRWFRPLPAPADGASVLWINDHPAKRSPDIRRQTERMNRMLELNGWTIIEDTELEARARPLLPSPLHEAEASISSRLEPLMDDAGLDGIVGIYASPSDSTGYERARGIIYRVPAGN